MAHKIHVSLDFNGNDQHASGDLRTHESVYIAMAEFPFKNLFLEIQDIIGPASLWPAIIRRIFSRTNLKHFDRIMYATFCYVNGLNPEVAMEWAMTRGLCRDTAAENHLKALFKLFDNGRKYKLYAFNVAMRRYEYLDGTVRTYVHKSERQ